MAIWPWRCFSIICRKLQSHGLLTECSGCIWSRRAASCVWSSRKIWCLAPVLTVYTTWEWGKLFWLKVLSCSSFFSFPTDSKFPRSLIPNDFMSSRMWPYLNYCASKNVRTLGCAFGCYFWLWFGKCFPINPHHSTVFYVAIISKFPLTFSTKTDGF